MDYYFSRILISGYLVTCVSVCAGAPRYLVLPKNAVGDLIRWITAAGSGTLPTSPREAQSWVESSLIPDKMGRPVGNGAVEKSRGWRNTL